jgi:hypothetical protein
MMSQTSFGWLFLLLVLVICTVVVQSQPFIGSNTQVLTIIDDGAASGTYDSSVINVSGIPNGSTFGSVQVSIPNITHNLFNYVIIWVQKDNVSVFLNYNEPPQNASVNGTALTYDDTGSSSYNVSAGVVQSGTYQPQVSQTPPPCNITPPLTAANMLANFSALGDLNGNWTLFVTGACALGFNGSVDAGWQLIINYTVPPPPPTAPPTAPPTTPPTTPTAPPMTPPTTPIAPPTATPTIPNVVPNAPTPIGVTNPVFSEANSVTSYFVTVLLIVGVTLLF